MSTHPKKTQAPESTDLPLVDSHCHLTYDVIQADFSGVLARAENAGVGAMMTICTELKEIPEIQKLVAAHDHIYGTVGVHPHEAEADIKKVSLKDLAQHLRDGLNSPGIIGLGETGLDYFYEHSPKKCQQDVFRVHLEVAAETNTPLIIHTRDANEDTIAMLGDYKGKVKGIIHCFSGTSWLAEKALEMGFYISASGIMTFKKADELRAIFQAVPLEKLLVETDAPYLAPVPYRGKSCEPAFVLETAKVLADLKKVTLSALTTQTTRNFMSLFNLSTLVKGH